MCDQDLFSSDEDDPRLIRRMVEDPEEAEQESENEWVNITYVKIAKYLVFVITFHLNLEQMSMEQLVKSDDMSNDENNDKNNKSDSDSLQCAQPCKRQRLLYLSHSSSSEDQDKDPFLSQLTQKALKKMQPGPSARRPRFIFTVEESAMIETATNHLPLNAVTGQIVEALEDDAGCRHHGLVPDAGRFSRLQLRDKFRTIRRSKLR